MAGYVKVRLSGEAAALGAAIALLVSTARDGGAEIADQSALYPNRRDPGCRVYLTLRLPDTAEDPRQAAHRPAPGLPGRHLP